MNQDNPGDGSPTRVGTSDLLCGLQERVRQLELAEEGAAHAFGVVVQAKQAAEAEVARLRAALESAHAVIRATAAERDEWARKWQEANRKYAQLRWPELTGTVKAL